MANLIDKDPEQIIQYTTHVNQRIDMIESKLRSIRELEGFMSDLHDKNCLILFKDLVLNCENFARCLDKLKTENDDIEQEAKKLKLIIEEGMGGRSV